MIKYSNAGNPTHNDVTHADNKRDYRKTVFELHYGTWTCTENRVSLSEIRRNELHEIPEKSIVILYPPNEKEVTAMICSLLSEEDTQEIEIRDECFYCGAKADFYPCEGCHQELCNDCMKNVVCPCTH